MKLTAIFVGVLALLGTLFSLNSHDDADDRLQLVWADEFDGSGSPDSTRWGFDLGDGCPDLCGWGNEELQVYTSDTRNVRVEQGNLVIEAHKDSDGRIFTSSRLVTRGKADWKYGRIEARMKLPSGKGTWPAFWMLPADWVYGGWPHSGEIDILEHVGYCADTIFGTVHTGAYNGMLGTHRGGPMYLPDAEEEFHVYAVEWTADRLDFFCDGDLYFSYTKESTDPEVWPFDQQFYLVLNFAVGGRWGGKHGVDTEIWPQKLEVDYVRIYKKT